jgi:hypothetical protein
MSHLKSEIIPVGRIVDVESEWWGGKGQVFLTWGILNPNGPTLYVLGSREFDGKHRNFMRWLHMFGGCTTYAAEAVSETTYEDIYRDAVSIHRHFIGIHGRGVFDAVPSFLIANGGDEGLAGIAKQLLAIGTAAQDWGRSLAHTRHFGFNFFARAGAEIRSTYDAAIAEARAKGEEPSDFWKWTGIRYGHLADFRDAKIPSWTESAITPELLEEWWQIVSRGEFQIHALVALQTMWEGAITVLSEEAKRNVVPWEAAFQFIEGYGLAPSN